MGADTPDGRAHVSGDAFLETYRAVLETRGVVLDELHTDETGTMRSRLRDAAPDDLPELAGFAVGDALGAGGMGLVSAAWQHSLGREVAVKSLRSRDHRPGDRAALVHEARITGQLEHPNVVPIHELGLTSHGDPIFAMKRVDGRPWSEWLAAPTPEQRARIDAAGGHLPFHLEVLIQVCNAVGYAHSKGILHRDLKPQNVMIGHFGEVYLVDWGIAARLSELGKGDPELVGTPAYMAPEMAAGDPLSIQSDLYQLGAVLFELVAGQPPRPRATAIKTMAVAWSGVLLPIPRGCPEGLAAVILRALAPDPAERHPSAAALQDELRAWLRDRPLLALAAEAQERVHAAIAGLAQPGSDPDPRALVRAARDAAAGLEPLRLNLRDPALDTLRTDLLSALLAFEVRRGRAGAAEAVLHELGDAATAAQRTLVEAAVRTEAARAAELALLRDQADWRYGRRLRQRYGVLLGVMQLVIYPTFGAIEVFWLNGPIPLPTFWATIFGIPSLVSLAVVLMRRSGPVYDTLGARTQRAIALMVVCANLAFLTCLAIGLDLQQAFFFTLTFSLGAPLAIQGVFTTPRFYAPAALFALTGVATMLVPRLYIFFVMPIGVALAHAAAYWTDEVSDGPSP